MITIFDIIDAYMNARKNKRRSSDQVEFELHWEYNCMRIYEDIVNRDFHPTAYTFITNFPKPREVFASDMGTRVLHHYLDIRIRPLLEARLSDHTFNNRVGMGQNACQNAAIEDIYAVSKGFTEDAWIIKLDMSGCFPNIIQDIAYRQLEDIILNDYHGNDKDEMIYILAVCVYSYPTHHCYRKSPLWKWKLVNHTLFSKPDGIGAAIGHLIWQNAVNYYFHEIDELVLGYGIRYERFVDDMLFVVNNKEAFLLFIPEIRRMLHGLGAKLNEKKFYCQHYTKGVEWVGSHIKMDRIYINNRTIRRGKMRAARLNKHINEEHVEHMIASMNSYLGMCKNVNGFNQAIGILHKLSPKWRKYVEFNRSRVCITPLPDYKPRNQIIKKFNLSSHEANRNRKRYQCAA